MDTNHVDAIIRRKAQVMLEEAASTMNKEIKSAVSKFFTSIGHDIWGGFGDPRPNTRRELLDQIRAGDCGVSVSYDVATKMPLVWELFEAAARRQFFEHFDWIAAAIKAAEPVGPGT